MTRSALFLIRKNLTFYHIKSIYVQTLIACFKSPRISMIFPFLITDAGSFERKFSVLFAGAGNKKNNILLVNSKLKSFSKIKGKDLDNNTFMVKEQFDKHINILLHVGCVIFPFAPSVNFFSTGYELRSNFQY